MLIGYARVSTNEQDTTTQTAALKVAGCERIFREKASGGRWDRPELRKLLDQLRKGDVVVSKNKTGSKINGVEAIARDQLIVQTRLEETKA